MSETNPTSSPLLRKPSIHRRSLIEEMPTIPVMFGCLQGINPLPITDDVETRKLVLNG